MKKAKPDSNTIKICIVRIFLIFINIMKVSQCKLNFLSVEGHFLFSMFHDFGVKSDSCYIWPAHTSVAHWYSGAVHQRLSVRIEEAEVMAVNMSNVERDERLIPAVWEHWASACMTLCLLWPSHNPSTYFKFLIYLISFFCILVWCYCTRLCNSVLYGSLDTGVVFSHVNGVTGGSDGWVTYLITCSAFLLFASVSPGSKCQQMNSWKYSFCSCYWFMWQTSLW